MKNYLYTTLLAGTALLFVACHDDLNQSPIDPDSFTEENVFANVTEAKSALAKVYASLALTGQQGPAGDPDIADIDEGFSQYTRMLFNLNELTTDHAVVAWGDPGLPDLHGMYWSSSNDFTQAMYFRLAQVVSFSNSFISNAAALSDPEVANFIAEARFIRAYAYSVLMDLFGNVPIVTVVTADLPQQNSRAEIFEFVETELLAIENLLPTSNEYGRVDQMAAKALLSRIYLNSEVWTGVPRYDACVNYSAQVMNSSYSLHDNYAELFMADNNSNGAQNEFIFTANFDGLNSQTYGGTTFLVHAAVGGSMDPADYGINGGWFGNRTTKNLVEKFTLDTAALNAALGTQSDWGLVGSATTNGWNGPDMEMYQTGTNTYSLYASLGAGELKFRFDEDWGNNYGDDGANGSLEPGGANIAVAPGNYFITLDLNTLTYSILSAGDKRGIFHTDGQNLEIEEIPAFGDGYAVGKFTNLDSNGMAGSDTGGNFVDTDLALIRLPEIMLNYAEASLRGGGGSTSTAVDAVNAIRTRGYGNTSGNITSGQLTLDFILDERSRELYWEGLRRTDLIRFGKFTTGSYLWPFKGDVPEGTSVDSKYNLFPLPTNALLSNPNLSQNDGYN
jgi:hypothetical protein